MLATEIAKRIKRQFGDEVSAQITDDDIIRWINDAQLEIVSQQELLRTVATTSTIPSVDAYTLPPNMNRMFNVRYKNNVLRQVNEQEAQEIIEADATPGAPVIWWVWGNSVFLYPAPNEVAELRLMYQRNPKTIISLTDALEVPEKYHLRIVEYGIAQAAELDDNLQMSQAKMGQFTTGLATLKATDNVSAMFYPFISELDPYSEYY